MATLQKTLTLAALVFLSMDSASYSQRSRFDRPVTHVGIPLKVQYNLARSVIVAEIVASEPKAEHNTLAKFKTLERWRGAEGDSLSATVRLWQGCLVNSQEYKNDLAPGKKFIVFVPTDFKQGAELVDILPLNDDSISKTKRLLWQTDNTIGKTREEIVKQAAAKGVQEAQKELSDLDTQGGRLHVYPSYTSSFYNAPPQKLRPELANRLFEKRTADLTAQIKKQNDNPYLYQERAEWNLATKHWDDAIADLSKTIELQKQDTEMAYVPWTIGDQLSGYSRTERREPGKKLSPGAAANEANRIKYQRKRRTRPLSELHALRAKAFRSKGTYGKAVQDFTEAAGIYPESQTTYLFERARTQYLAGNYKAAVADVGETLKSKDSGYGESARANRIFLKACANYKQGNYQACIQDMSKLITDGYGSNDPIAWRALAERKSGQIKQFEKDVQLFGTQGQGAVEELVLLKRDSETKALLDELNEKAIAKTSEGLKDLANSLKTGPLKTIKAQVEKIFATRKVPVNVGLQQYNTSPKPDSVAIEFKYHVDMTKLLSQLKDLPLEKKQNNGYSSYLLRKSWGTITIHDSLENGSSVLSIVEIRPTHG